MTRDHAERVAELADRYGRMVFATAYRILGDAEEAEDALQEVFMKLLSPWNGRVRSDDVRDWGAYLRVMASRCAVDLLRRKSKWRWESVELSEKFEAPAEQNPRRLAGQRQMAELLRQALGALRRRDAAVFALRHFEDLSYEEIASQMGLSVNSVGVILHRARNRLREILEPILAPAHQHEGMRRDRPKTVKGE